MSIGKLVFDFATHACHRHALKTPSGFGLLSDTYPQLEAPFFLLRNMIMFKLLGLTTYSSWFVSERASDDYLVCKISHLHSERAEAALHRRWIPGGCAHFPRLSTQGSVQRAETEHGTL
jgi:hypothetical protein